MLAVVFKLRVAKCLYSVMSYMKKTNKKRKQTIESAQYGLEISFKGKGTGWEGKLEGEGG